MDLSGFLNLLWGHFIALEKTPEIWYNLNIRAGYSATGAQQGASRLLLNVFIKARTNELLQEQDESEIILDKAKGYDIMRLLAPRLTSRKGSGGVFYL